MGSLVFLVKSQRAGKSDPIIQDFSESENPVKGNLRKFDDNLLWFGLQWVKVERFLDWQSCARKMYGYINWIILLVFYRKMR